MTDSGPAQTDPPKRRVVIQRSVDDSPPPPVEQSGGGGTGCVWAGLGTVAILAITCIVAVGLVIATGTTTVNNIISGIESMFTGGPPVARIEPSQTIVTSIRAMGQLVSVSAQMAKADIDVSIQQGVFGASSFSASHAAQGAVEAGIDLTQLTPEDIVYDEIADKYTITLPAPQLTSCRVEFIRQYASSFNLVPVDRDEARQLAQYVALIDFREDALEGGILTRAEEQAALVFGNVVETITGHSTQIEFRDPEGSPLLPPSCEPDTPGAWHYDPETRSWAQPE
jgi:hypothetical protein